MTEINVTSSEGKVYRYENDGSLDVKDLLVSDYEFNINLIADEFDIHAPEIGMANFYVASKSEELKKDLEFVKELYFKYKKFSKTRKLLLPVSSLDIFTCILWLRINPDFSRWIDSAFIQEFFFYMPPLIMILDIINLLINYLITYDNQINLASDYCYIWENIKKEYGLVNKKNY